MNPILNDATTATILQTGKPESSQREGSAGVIIEQNTGGQHLQFVQADGDFNGYDSEEAYTAAMAELGGDVSFYNAAMNVQKTQIVNQGDGIQGIKARQPHGKIVPLSLAEDADVISVNGVEMTVATAKEVVPELFL